MAVKTTEKDKGKKPGKAPSKTDNLVRGMMSELKKVTWPTKKEVTVYTIVVVATVVVFTVIIGGFDLIFGELIRLLVSL